ncbi:MAG: tRNA(Ile)-lysidine synthase [Cyclobacteriaceae bacterium]|nr:MAG: tRNA(Ile)-lysidine synthase [Cyclobacteriaceae bacterium]
MDNSLIRQTDVFITKEGLLDLGEKVLVAVSGGVDSMVLLHILQELGYNTAIAHANFQLRGEESELDEQLIRQIADSQEIPLHIRRFNTREYAKDQGISVQMAARDLRYAWFKQVMKDHGYHKVAVAHHLNDLLETLLLNITRGTGIAGLHGILPQQGAIIRPLIFTDKQNIQAYADDRDIKWREDRSNSDESYQRNLIRHQVVPILKKINPALEATTKNTVEILKSVEDEFNKAIQQYRQQMIIEEGGHIRIPKSRLRAITPPILKEVIGDYGFVYDQCKLLLGSTIDQTGKVFYSDTHTLNVDREEIIISPKSKESVQAVIDCNQDSISIGGYQWQILHYQSEQYHIKNMGNTAAFDFEKLDFPLKVRGWLPGDRFYPLGMTGQKKLSDFFIDNKVPRNLKTETLVLLSGDNIAWVVGHRIDNRYKITNKTRKVLEISVAL